MALRRIKISVPAAFNPESQTHVAAVVAKVEQQDGNAGWKFVSFDPETRKATLELRQAGSSIRSESADRKVVNLDATFKTPSDGERADSRFSALEYGQQGFVMTEFDPYNGFAVLERLTERERRCREALATALGVKPWLVKVGATKKGGFRAELPAGYMPSRHDEKIEEVATAVIGKFGWYVDFDRERRQIEIVPSEPPTFPGGIPYPVDRIAELSSQDRLLFGQYLGKNGDDPGDYLWIDFSDGPHTVLQGTTSSGKAACVDTLIPTPSGWIRMGDLQVGDEVLGRDGRPCRVIHVTPIFTAASMYRITLSDGQVIDADGDHQWAVASLLDRQRLSSTSRKAAIARRGALHAAAAQIRGIADGFGPEETLSISELADTVLAVPGVSWTTRGGVKSALAFLEVAPVADRSPVVRAGRAAYEAKQRVALYPARETLLRIAETTRGEVGSRALALAATASGETTKRELSAGLRVGISGVEHALRRGGVKPSRRESRIVQMPAEAPHAMRSQALRYPARQALRALAGRAEWLAIEEAKLGVEERVLTTAEIAASGERLAIRTAQALELPEADLPIDPYTVGAWLGDGISSSCGVVSADPQIIDEIIAGGYGIQHIAEKHGTAASDYFFDGLRSAMYSCGLWEVVADGHRGKLAKRIPALYLRASKAQRLAVLQGLMDTDGTIDEGGSCELYLSDPDLAADALELIRSLGIRASKTVAAASYRGADGAVVPCRDRHRIHFTTSEPVFRLERKKARLRPEPSGRSDWLAIEKVERIDPVPVRCIQVDSPDAMYLCAGFVPTHNTVTINALIAGAAASGMELVIVDIPAKSVDFLWCQKFVRPGGWGCGSPKEALAALDRVYREGSRRADILKAKGKQNLAQLDEADRAQMPRIFIVVDELAGILRKTDPLKALDRDDPRRAAAEEENAVKALTLRCLLKIAAEMRFVGLHLLLSTQVANVNTGVPTELRDNASNKLLMGVGANDRVRATALQDPMGAPEIPSNIKEDPKAGRGVGVAELPGQPTRIFKGLFATTDDFAKAMERVGVPERPLSLTVPSSVDIDVALGSDGMEDFSGGPLEGDPDAAAMLGDDGRPLKGAAAAAAASKRHAG